MVEYDYSPETTQEERIADLVAICPEGFKLPARLLELMVDPLSDIDPFFWLGYHRDGLREWSAILKDQFPDRVLVPFAKHANSDDVFCFDGEDRSGDPQVLIIHSYTTPGWEYRGRWLNLEGWLEECQLQHDEWLEGDAD
jgi:hypothetical protein